MGFKTKNTGVDDNGAFCDIAIRPGTTLEHLYEFTQAADVAAVSFEPGDIERLYGKSFGSLAVRRSLELDGNAGVRLLQPDEMIDGLNSLWMSTITDGSGEVDPNMEQFIMDDLVAEGYLDEKEEASIDAWANPATPPDSARNAYSGEWAIEPDVFDADEDWGR